MIPAISASVYAACASASGREQREGKKKGWRFPHSTVQIRRPKTGPVQLAAQLGCSVHAQQYNNPPRICRLPAAASARRRAKQGRRGAAASSSCGRPPHPSSVPCCPKKTLFFSAHTSLPSHHAPRRRPPALRTAPRATPRHAARAATGTPSAPPPRARSRALALAFTTLRTGEVGITKAAAGGVGPTTRNCDGFAAFFFGLLVCMSRFARAAVVAVDGIMGSNQLGARRDGTAVVGSLYHPFTAKIGARHHHSLRRLPDAKIHGPHPLLIPPMGNGKKK